MELQNADSSTNGDFRNFKPMYTLQPVKSTRDKQLKQWSNIIMKFCKDNNTAKINPHDFALFSNDAIDRKLSDEAVTAVVDNMIKTGRCCAICGTPPGVLSTDISNVSFFIQLSS